MMNIDDHKLDDLFRQRLSEYSPEPPPGAWGRIEEGLGHRKLRLLWIRRLSAAAVLLLAVTTSLVLWNAGDRAITEQVAEQPAGEGASLRSESPSQPGNSTLTATLPAAVENRASTAVEDLSAVASSDALSQKVTAAIPVTSSSSVLSENEKVVNRSVTLVAMKAISGFADNSLIIRALQTLRTPVEKRGFIADISGSPVISRNSTSETREKERTNNWKVGVQVAPGYSSYNSDYNTLYASNMTRSVDASHAGVGGGVSVQYKTSRRLRIESGMYYSRTGDKQESSGRELFSFADYGESNSSTAPLKLYNNAVQLSDGRVGLNSTAGVIRLNASSVNAEFIALPERNGELDNSFSMLTSGGFAQVFDFMEVPLNVRYRLIDARLALELFSGISTNFIVGNNVYLDNAAGQQKVGSTSDISPVTFSGMAGIALIYPLGKHFSFSMEPQANYWLNSLNKSNSVEFRPWRVGIQTGLFYEF